MRKEPTPAEKTLWVMLRGRALSEWKFRRQHPIGEFIVDFYCPQLGLAIEVDGAAHFDEIGAIGDSRRTEKLEALGISVLRFENAVVVENGTSVLNRILDEIRKIQAGCQPANPSPPAPLPASRGEGRKA